MMQKILNWFFSKKDSKIKIIHEKFEALLILVRPTISETDFEFIATELRNGEEWLALEILCEKIDDYQTPISKDIYASIGELIELMNMPVSYLDLIKPLVTSEG